MDERELLWKQYALNVDLYKFYLELVVKVNAFYYAITGAILAYYFQHSMERLSRFAVLLPILFSLALSAIFIYVSSLLGVIRSVLFKIRHALGLDTERERTVLK